MIWYDVNKTLPEIGKKVITLTKQNTPKISYRKRYASGRVGWHCVGEAEYSKPVAWANIEYPQKGELQ